jgi:glycoside/pentoside/hexuronide:cation symporter, GPH family
MTAIDARVTEETGERRTPRDRVPLGIKLGYASGNLGISILQISAGFLLLYFYTDVVGIAPAKAGLIIFVGTFVDALCNLLVAWLTTRNRSRLGRYRSFLLYGSVPIGIAFATMFFEPGLPPRLVFAYAFITYMLYRTCYAFILMPHGSLIGRLSSDANERSSVGAYKSVANHLGLLAGGYLGISTVEWLGGADQRWGFALFGMLFGAMGTAFFLICGLTTRERVSEASLQKDTSSFIAALPLMFRNGQYLIVLWSTIFFFMGYIMLTSGILYYFKYVLVEESHAKHAVVALSFGGLASAPAWNWLIKRSSKAFVWASGSAIMVLFLGILYAVPGLSLTLVLLCYLMIGIGKGPILINYYAIVSDAVDYGQWKLGKRAEAYSWGLFALSNKVGTAIGGGMMGVLLAWAGLRPNMVQTAAAVDRIWLVTCLSPAVAFMLSGAAILLFRVTATRHMDMLAEVAGRAEADTGVA